MDFDDLPDGWELVELEKIFDIQGGSQPAKENFIYEPQPGYMRLLQIRDFGENEVPTYIPDNLVTKTCQKEDILIARYGASLGRIVTGMEGAYNVALAKVIFNNNLIFRGFVFYLLQTPFFQVPIHMTSRSAQNGFNKSEISSIVLPLPPLNEQKRIVEKIELIQERTTIVKRELENIKVLLKKFRRSLLASAFRGDLTKDWRANHPDIEPAEVLLERIKKERREKWEQAELEKMRAKGITPKDDKWKSKYSEPQPVKNIDDLPSIPDGWCWGTVEQFADVGTGATPLKKKKEYYENGTIPWVTSGSLNDLFITNPDNYITPLALKETNTKIFPKHTLLVAMYGEGKTRGKVSELLIEATTNQACAAILIEGIATEIKPMVKLFFLKNYDDLRKLAAGGVQPNLNLTMIKLTAVPLPPLEEQKEIVRKLEKMMKFADRVEERVKEAEEKLDKFNQSVLAKAFRGKLVPQDPNDEPASVLLGKIQQEKNKTTSKKTKK